MLLAAFAAASPTRVYGRGSAQIAGASAGASRLRVPSSSKAVPAGVGDEAKCASDDYAMGRLTEAWHALLARIASDFGGAAHVTPVCDGGAGTGAGAGCAGGIGGAQVAEGATVETRARGVAQAATTKHAPMNSDAATTAMTEPVGIRGDTARV